METPPETVEEVTATQTSEAEPNVSPIPPCFFWSLFIPTFAVLVMGLQTFSKVRSSPPPPEEG